MQGPVYTDKTYPVTDLLFASCESSLYCLYILDLIQIYVWAHTCKSDKNHVPFNLHVLRIKTKRNKKNPNKVSFSLISQLKIQFQFTAPHNSELMIIRNCSIYVPVKSGDINPKSTMCTDKVSDIRPTEVSFRVRAGLMAIRHRA